MQNQIVNEILIAKISTLQILIDALHVPLDCSPLPISSQSKLRKKELNNP